MIVLECLFLTIALCDAAEPWQLGFQDAATPMMQGIMDLHHDIFFFLILILVFVLWILVRALWHFHYQKNPIPQRIVHGTTIEIIWTIFPSLILMFIAIPSFALLYSMDEVVVDPAITIKAIGHQWYWTYEYSDYNSSDEESLTFDSYMIPEDDLELGQLRLLEVDNRVVVPAKTHLRFLVTSADVLHSWAVPSYESRSANDETKKLAFFSHFLQIAFCDGNNALSPPPSPVPQLEPAEEPPFPQPPVAVAPVIPRLPQPLLPDYIRSSLLYNRFVVLNFGGDFNLNRLVSIIYTQIEIEKLVEAALVDDGFNPHSLIFRNSQIRGILFYPRGGVFSQETYSSYLRQILGEGTRHSVPYRRIIGAIRNRDLLL